MTRSTRLIAASLALGSAAMWLTSAEAAQFALRITAPAGTTIAGTYVLTRDDGSQFQERIADIGAAEIRFEGRVIRLTLHIASGRGPVQAELLRDGSQVAQATASGAGGVMTLTGGR